MMLQSPGCKLYVGAARLKPPANNSLAEFEGEPWTQVCWLAAVENIDDSHLRVAYLHDDTDRGQQLIAGRAPMGFWYAYRIEFDDAEGPHQLSSELLFLAKITAKQVEVTTDGSKVIVDLEIGGDTVKLGKRNLDPWLARIKEDFVNTLN
jgi:hypothetical protein